MKLSNYVFNNLSQKRVRTILSVVGIALSLTSSVVMALLTDYYSSLTSTFFRPFPEYDQVVERGTSYIQLIPTGSSISLDFQTELDSTFQEHTIPLLIVPNSEDLLSFYNNYIFGVPISQQKELFKSLSLQQGRWPQNSDEIIVGNKYLDMKNMEVLNHNFTIVGVFFPQYSYLDRIIIVDHTKLEQLSNNVGKTSIIFISKAIEANSDKISFFEKDYPEIDVLTTSEIEELHGQIGTFMNNLTQVLSVFTAGASIIFVFSLEVMNLFSRKADFDILRVLGSSSGLILKTIIMENMILLGLGIVIGVPASVGIFSILYAFIIVKVNTEAQFFSSFSKGFRFIFNPFHWELFLQNILIISSAVFGFALLISLIGMHRYQLSQLKQKY
ncbi:MAG: hypothetical protein DRO88_12435 [Promethearchaeia archaeon]|nr:MAG: hypothetical protein DRO88_12435 [Candidatus Lokiarchaeia archaeon]